MAWIRSASPWYAVRWRRFNTIIGIVALFLLLFVYMPPSAVPRIAIQQPIRWAPLNPEACPNVPPPVPIYRDAKDAQFKWRSVAEKYPVENLMTMSRSMPKRLRRVQHASLDRHVQTAKDEIRQAEVRNVFLRGWNSYKDRAWMKDELMPISGSWKNKFGGLAATLVDSLDTLWIMGLKQEFNTAVRAVMDISFNEPKLFSGERISVFETTIRYLGGLLSAYDLSGCRDRRLLDKAVELGEMLYKAFDQPNRVPPNHWNAQLAFEGVAQSNNVDGCLAELGSLTLEFTHLSQLTGDMRWYDAVQRITNLLDRQQNKTRLPGLWPKHVNLRTADFTQRSDFSLGAEADSAYEYLPKMIALLGGRETEQYERMWNHAADAASKHLLYRPMTPDDADVLLPGVVDSAGGAGSTPGVTAHSEHLGCFVGGMWALGGRLTGRDAQVDVGRALADGCAWAYRATPAGIAPESFVAVPCASRTRCAWNETVWRRESGGGLSEVPPPRGLAQVTDPKYLLRPEAVESIFYMYRVTGDARWKDVAWDMFQAIESATKTPFGNAELTSVLLEPAPQEDSMESFWFAETLKYLYLIFSDPGLISLDDYVFNTEAHPFTIPKPT
jgi:mannosyl-oligosaccharide alpha-1,2-mannosidase